MVRRARAEKKAADAALRRYRGALRTARQALGRVDNYLIHKTMAAIVTTAR
jgi:replication initiation protein RepC